MLSADATRAVLQIEISRVYGQTEWRDDIRRMLMKAGIIGKPMVFLFADNQVTSKPSDDNTTTYCNSKKLYKISKRFGFGGI